MRSCSVQFSADRHRCLFGSGCREWVQGVCAGRETDRGNSEGPPASDFALCPENICAMEVKY